MPKKITLSILLIQPISYVTIQAMQRVSSMPVTSSINGPLHLAAKTGDLPTIISLLSSGANVNESGLNGATPLFIAAERGQENAVKLLLLSNRGTLNLDKSDNKGCSPLFAASQQGYAAIVQTLFEAHADVNQPDNAGITPLNIAAQIGHAAVVHTLCEAHADVNQPDNDGITPLYAAVYYSGDHAIALELISAGANLNRATNCGLTPLHAAAQNGHLEVAYNLLTSGANSDLTTREDYEFGYDVTLDNGKLNIKNTNDKNSGALYKGLKPLHCAVEVHRQLKALIKSLDATNPYLQAYRDILNKYKEIIILLSEYDFLKLRNRGAAASSSNSFGSSIALSDPHEAPDKRDKEAADFQDPHGKRSKRDE